jgi:hypothetical protein
MSLPANQTITIGSETYLQEPVLPALAAAVQALCAAAGHPEWLPQQTTRTVNGTIYIETPKLSDLAGPLRLLGATIPANITSSIGSTTHVQTPVLVH